MASLILGALRADLNDLASEVKRSYEYVLSCYPGRRAADLVLCGGGSLLHYFPEFLGNALGIPVRRASSYLQDSGLPPGSPGTCRLRFASAAAARPVSRTTRESCVEEQIRRVATNLQWPLEVLAVAVGLAISE